MKFSMCTILLFYLSDTAMRTSCYLHNKTKLPSSFPLNISNLLIVYNSCAGLFQRLPQSVSFLFYLLTTWVAVFRPRIFIIFDYVDGFELLDSSRSGVFTLHVQALSIIGGDQGICPGAMLFGSRRKAAVVRRFRHCSNGG